MKTRNIVVLSLAAATVLYGAGVASKRLPAPWNPAPVLSTRRASVAPSGRAVTETRAVGAFDSIEAAGSVELVVTQGPSPSLAVTADAALLPEFRTELRGGTLRIGYDGAARVFGGVTPRVELVVADLDRVELSGAARLELGPGDFGDLTLDASGTLSGMVSGSFDTLDVTLSGAGTLLLVGKAERLELSSPGASGVDAAAFDAAEARVEIAGVGTVDLGRTRKLDVSLSGLGSLTYRGDPELRTSVSGLGKVTRKGD